MVIIMLLVDFFCWFLVGDGWLFVVILVAMVIAFPTTITKTTKHATNYSNPATDILKVDFFARSKL